MFASLLLTQGRCHRPRCQNKSLEHSYFRSLLPDASNNRECSNLLEWLPPNVKNTQKQPSQRGQFVDAVKQNYHVVQRKKEKGQNRSPKNKENSRIMTHCLLRRHLKPSCCSDWYLRSLIFPLFCCVSANVLHLQNKFDRNKFFSKRSALLWTARK